MEGKLDRKLGGKLEVKREVVKLKGNVGRTVEGKLEKEVGKKGWKGT